MNYLSSSNYFHIKNLFSILFIQFKRSLDWASFTGKHRVLGARFPRLSQQCPWTAGSISTKSRGSYAKELAEGVSANTGRRMMNRASGLDHAHHRTHATLPLDPNRAVQTHDRSGPSVNTSTDPSYLRSLAEVGHYGESCRSRALHQRR